MEQFQRGEQIAYVPRHAQIPKDDGTWSWGLEHLCVEFGFVMHQREEFVFCRYWRRNELGLLRTTANSEATPVDCLVRWRSVRPGVVWETIQRIERVKQIADSLAETPAMPELPTFDPPTTQFFPDPDGRFD